MGKCLHIDSSNWLATGFWLSIFSRCTAQVRLAYVTVDLLCWCAVHTVYVVRLCTAVLEPRTAASISQAAGGSCIISHLQQSVPTRFHGRHSTLRRPQCFALVSRLSKRHQHVSEEKKETASLQSNPPPLQSSILASIADWNCHRRRVRRCEALVRTHHAVCCAGEHFVKCSPAFRTSTALFERFLASPACPGVSSIVDGEECGALVEWHWQAKQKYSKRNCASATVSTISLTRTGLGSNPCLLGAVSSFYLSGNTL